MSAALKDIDTTEPFLTSGPQAKHPASGGQRTIAFLIDACISTVGAMVLMSFFAVLLPGGAVGFGLNLAIAMLVFPAIYWVSLPSLFGATPGKKLLGIEIVDARSLVPASSGQLLARELVGRPLSAFVFLIGYIWFWVSEDQSTWHDLLAKTKVVQS